MLEVGGCCRNRNYDDLICIPFFLFMEVKEAKKMKECCLVCTCLYHDLQCHYFYHKEVFGPKYCCCSDRQVTGSVLKFCTYSCQWFMRLLFPQQIASFYRTLSHILPTVWGRRNGCVIEPTYHGQKLPIFKGHSVNILWFCCFSCSNVVFSNHHWTTKATCYTTSSKVAVAWIAIFDSPCRLQGSWQSASWRRSRLVKFIWRESLDIN
jgi:hypothetical protein